MLYPIMEQYYTVQGEGYNMGVAAHFIRLGGCDVGCVWCDVKESWDAAKHSLTEIDTIINWLKESKAKFAVITGGEPCMYNLNHLTEAIHATGCNTWLETSGAYPISGTWDWICVSPKKFKPPLSASLKIANELKVVVFHPSDIEWAAQHALLVNSNCKLFLQPEFSKQDKVLPIIIDFVKTSPNWRISLQTHKFMNIP
ncbi:MAG: radical SAM protein [Bacteroidetes bacterium]|nr:radical SAM protein [Bacteroidota bacterium]